MLGEGDRTKRGYREGHINVGMLHPFDEEKIASIFVELYAVGQRPTAEEMRAFLAGLWPRQSERQRKRIVGFWERVLKNQEHRFRCLADGWPWRRPFILLDRISAADGLPSVGEQLRNQLFIAADAFLAMVSDPEATWNAVARATRSLSYAEQALRVWGEAQDARDDSQWSHPFILRHDPTRLPARRTKRGRDCGSQRPLRA